MVLGFRAATGADAPAISDVMTACWPDDTADSGRIARLLHADTGHYASVALADGGIVGFVSGFPTTARTGQRRWEVDLLAVLPAFRSRGVARSMIKHNLQAARRANAVLARGLVHVDNPASQRAFAACGFAAQAALVHLTLSSQPANSARVHSDGWLLAVETFGYRGIWLEGDFSPAAFLAARQERDSRGYDIAGAVVPAAAMQTAFSSGFRCVGDYHWWTTHLVS